MPDEARSYAICLLNRAGIYGFDKQASIGATERQLERMIAVAAMKNGEDVFKNNNMESLGRFYSYVGQTRKKLIEEKQKRDLKENG